MCILFLLFIKSRMNVGVVVSYLLCISVILASGTLRSYKGLQPWLQENTKGTHTRYASTLLHSYVFLSRPMNCTIGKNIDCPAPADYLLERLGRADPQVL